MPAKVCPRCGAQYQNLKSTTCPQCFAVLIPIDDATAEEFAAARREVEETPEFQQVKAADDERFKEQSFGACLGVVAMTVVTVILAIVFIVLATHHTPVRNQRAQNPTPQNWGGGSYSTLPVAAATPNEVLPMAVGRYRRVSMDSGTVLTGTLTPLLHASYSSVGQSPLDLYALPAGRPTPEQNEFRLGLTVASQLGGENRSLLFFSTEYWHFAILAAPGQSTTATAFQSALIAGFQKP